jgi:nucleoid-associated protein YgaU
MHVGRMQWRLWLATAAITVALTVMLAPGQLLSAAHAGAAGLHPGAAGGSANSAAVSLLTALVGATAWSCASWLVLLCLLDAIAIVPGRIGRFAERARRRITPRAMARLLCSGMLAGSTLGVAAPAFAAGSLAPAVHATPCAHDPIPDLDRPGAHPAACTPAATHVTTVPAGAVSAVYVVHRDDTLWALAAAELRAEHGTPPTNAAIAARWPAWWQANRAQLGTDPALLHPGEHLAVPPR